LNPASVDRLMAVSVPVRGASVSSRLHGSPAASLLEWLLGKDPAHEPINREAAKGDPLAIETSLRAVTDLDLREELRALSAPYLLVYGEKDMMITPPEEGWQTGLDGNVHSIGLEESRHFPMLDEAAKFNRLLTDFLSLKSGESLSNLGLKDEWKRRVR